MAFPLEPERWSARTAGTYRGFPVYAYTTGSGPADDVTIDRHICVGLPVRTLRLTIETRGPLHGEGGIAVGWPPFDRHHTVRGDVGFVRAVMTPEVVRWLLGVGWRELWDQTALPGELVLGPERAEMSWSRRTSRDRAQAITDFIIDFLHHTPARIWPAPLPREPRPAS